MKALIKLRKGPGFTELHDIPEPLAPGPTEVKAEIKYCGICGTDIKIYHGDHRYYKPPLTLGHEFSAVVVEVGREVKNIKVGDEIVIAPRIPAVPRLPLDPWEKPWNKRRAFDAPWGSTRYGGMTKYGVYDEDLVLKLPPNVDLESAALTEPLAICVHGIIDQGMVHCTDVVVVSGPGPIGLLSMQIAKAEGAYVIICGIEGDESKLEIARQLGADIAVNVSKEDPMQAILDLTYGGGADVVIECAGSGSSVNQLMRYSCRKGQFIQIGTSAHKYEIDFMQVSYKELKVIGSFSSMYTDWEKSLKLMSSGRVKAKPIVSHKFPLSAWQEAFHMLENRKGMKILLYPD